MNLRYRKITIKIGSNVLTKSDGTLNEEIIEHLVDQISIIKDQGVEVIVVSSGAVAAGKAVLSSLKKSDAISSRQIWSALGQVKLINKYTDIFNRYGLVCAQVLTTKENFSSRAHYLNMKNCINSLLENNIVPVVNENDTISVNELMFTDNDELSGLIASMADSEGLIILSNIDGIFDGPPDDKNSKVIPEFINNDFQPEIVASSKMSGFGRGGMLTKYRISRKVAKEGIGVHIANGTKPNILADVMDIDKTVVHTHFIPDNKTTSNVKKWISYSDSFAKSNLIINKGAIRALFSNKAVSLLPVGIIKVNGEFKKGDLIRIFDEKNRFLGVGKAQYNSERLAIESKKEKQKPIIHYDYLYLEDINIDSEYQ